MCLICIIFTEHVFAYAKSCRKFATSVVVSLQSACSKFVKYCKLCSCSSKFGELVSGEIENLTV